MTPDLATSDRRFATEAREDGIHVKLDGRLGLEDAYPLRDMLVGMLPGPVIVDFSRVDSVADVFLGILGLWLAEPRDGDIRVAGLGQHGASVLRYCDPENLAGCGGGRAKLTRGDNP